MRCAYCHEPLPSVGAVRCARCRTAVHGECADLHGACVTLACGGAAFEPLPPRAGREPLRYREAPARRLERGLRLGAAGLRALVGQVLVLAAAVGLATLGFLCLSSTPASRSPIPPLSRVR